MFMVPSSFQKSSAMKGSIIRVQLFSTVIFPYLIRFTLLESNETQSVRPMNKVSCPTNNAQSTPGQRYLKTEVLL